MGAGISMRAGDEVVIKFKDVDMVKQMQINHGGWNDAMEECLLGPCKLIQPIGVDAVVKAPSGSTYRLNSELLMKYNKPGESILLTSDESVLRTGLDSSNRLDELKSLVGQRVELVQKTDDGRCTVKHKSKVYTLNENCITSCDGARKNSSSTFCVGDWVTLTSDANSMKRLQEGHGGWSELMRLLLGQEVEVKEVFIDGDLHVSWSGTDWLINPRCIGGDRDHSDTKREPLQKGDLVLISNDIEATKEMQRFHGSWIETMKAFAGQTGRVESVLLTGDVRVKISGTSILYNPLVLTKISDEESLLRYSVGDIVKVIDDKNRMKVLQKGHGEWNEFMNPILGQKGLVKFVFPDGDLQVKIKGSKVKLNPDCVVKVKSDNNDLNNRELDKILNKNSSIDLSDDTQEEDQNNDNAIIDNMFHYKSASLTKTSRSQIWNGELHFPTERIRIGSRHSIDLPFVGSHSGDSALHEAVRNKDYDTCCRLVEDGVDVNARNEKSMTPIMLAAQIGYKAILSLLSRHLDARLDIGDLDNDTALHLAVQNSKTESVRILLEAGADIKAINNKQFNPYHMAALRGHEKILELCLDKFGGSLVDLQKDDKFAALHLATLNNHTACLRLLIRHKADLNIRNNKMQTALHIAVSQKCMDCVKILVESEAEVNLRDEDGDTPLHSAIRLNNMDKMKRMSGMFGLEGMFNLMGALQRGTDEPADIAIYLVEHGASLTILNSLGKSPLTECEDQSLQEKLLNMQTEEGQTASCNDHVPPTGTDHSETRSRDDELEAMREKIKRLEEEKLCVICYDNYINMTLGCGHRICEVCANNVYECPICRKKIDKKIRNFY